MVLLPTARARPALILSFVAAAALSACGAQAETVDRGVPASTSTATSQSRVVIPGAPGESAEVIEPGESFEITEDGYSELDIRFVEQMIPHHQQAIDMAHLAPDRADDERVLAFAERVAASQHPEITALEAWLKQRGLPVPERAAGDGHSHGDMPGMVSPFQMQLLEDASGREFDELFLTYMSNHHAGAIEMAQPVVTNGVDAIAIEMANDVSVTQAAEIERMRAILDDL